MDQQEKLKNKTITGMLWSFFSTIGTQLIQLLVQVVLARLLMPEDFGIIGMVTVIIALSQTFVESGFTKGLIREKESTQEDYSTVFFFNLGMSTVLYIILFFTADFISTFFREPQLVSIIRVLSLVLIINAFGLVQNTMLIKCINFKVQAKISIFSIISSGSIAIIFALQGFGVWSLVIQKLVNQFLLALLFSITNHWSPSLVFSTSSFKRLFGFGWKLLVARMLTTLYQNIYYLIIGRVFSVTDLGYYTNARKLKDAAVNSITTSVQKVSYPVLSNIQDDNERLKRGYKLIIKNSAYVTFPFMLGLSSIAPVLLRVLLGENWVPAIPYFQVLCIGGMLYPLNAINLNILQVKGRSDLYLLVSILKKVKGIILIAIALYLELGMIGLMWFSVAGSFISVIINTYYTKKLLSYSIVEQVKDVSGFFVMSFLMATVVVSINSFPAINNILILALQIITGLILYIGMSLIFKVPEYGIIYGAMHNIFKKVFSGGLEANRSMVKN